MQKQEAQRDHSFNSDHDGYQILLENAEQSSMEHPLNLLFQGTTGVPALAIDGDINTFIHTMKEEFNWWKADFSGGETFKVASVKIITRDAYPNRLAFA